MKGARGKCPDCAARDELLEQYLTKFMDLVDEFGESMVGEEQWQRWRLQEAEFLLTTNGYRVESMGSSIEVGVEGGSPQSQP